MLDELRTRMVLNQLDWLINIIENKRFKYLGLCGLIGRSRKYRRMKKVLTNVDAHSAFLFKSGHWKIRLKWVKSVKHCLEINGLRETQELLQALYESFLLSNDVEFEIIEGKVFRRNYKLEL